ncbi:hypothetical protein AB0L67_36665, partial [Streptomyces flaveolus]|uniref:hypothetical protein n=1 Tax=Streptomyces flaveolus TaxID=67297 RepID=UPI0034188786
MPLISTKENITLAPVLTAAAAALSANVDLPTPDVRGVLGHRFLPGRRHRRGSSGHRRGLRGAGNGRTVRSRGQRRQRALQVLDAGAAFLQESLGEDAG